MSYSPAFTLPMILKVSLFLSLSSCKVGPGTQDASVLNSDTNCPSKTVPVSDQGISAWIFSWTRSPNVHLNPSEFVRGAMASAQKPNQEFLDPNHEVIPSMSQGNGLYFSGDPLQSYGGFGRNLLVAKTLPFAGYSGSPCAKKGAPVVFSSTSFDDYRKTIASSIPGLLYQFGMGNFVSTLALVLRGNQAQEIVNLSSLRTFDFTFSSGVVSNNRHSLWDDPLMPTDSKMDVAALMEPFLKWRDLAFIYSQQDSSTWFAGGQLTLRGIVAGLYAHAMDPKSGVHSKFQAMLTGPLQNRLKNTSCESDFPMCIGSIHLLLDSGFGDLARDIPLSAQILGALDLASFTGDTASVSTLQKSVSSVWASRFNTEKMRAAVRLIELFKLKLTEESLMKWQFALGE